MSEMNKRIKVHDTIIDFVAHKIYLQVEGTQLLNGTLSEKQATLLKLFVRNYPANTTRQEIMAELWPNGFISPESVNQIINKTRKAIRDIHKDKIVNDPGKGYRLGALEFLALAESADSSHETNEPTLYSVDESADISERINGDSIKKQHSKTLIASDNPLSEEVVQTTTQPLTPEQVSQADSALSSERQINAESSAQEISDTPTPQRRVSDRQDTPKRRASDQRKSARAMSFAKRYVHLQRTVLTRKLSKSTYVICVIITFINMALMANGLYDWAHSAQFVKGIENQPSSRFMKSYEPETKILKGRTFKGEYFECVIDVNDKDSICHTVD